MNSAKISYRVPEPAYFRLKDEQKRRGLRSHHEAAKILTLERLAEDPSGLRELLARTEHLDQKLEVLLEACEQLLTITSQVPELADRIDKFRRAFDAAVVRDGRP